MNTSSAVRRTTSNVVSRLPEDAVTSRNVSSSAPPLSYRCASSTGSPASRSPSKLMPLTTRPASTSRHGITRTATAMTSPVVLQRLLLDCRRGGEGGIGSDAAGVDAADQDGAGAEVVQLVHDPVGFLLRHHGPDGDPVRVAQRRNRGRLESGGKRGSLFDEFLADVVVHQHVLACH